ncbi:MAG: lysyl-tRNA synthetase [Angustibacter sp.]
MFKALLALIPPAGVLFLFVVVIRAMMKADRSEREAAARWEKDHPEPK